MRGKNRALDHDGAALLALDALRFLATEPARLDRFLRLTGLTLERLRAEADTTRVQAAVLDHLLQDESLLLAFTANNGVSPADVAPARALLVRQP